jgi:hypothetical protein
MVWTATVHGKTRVAEAVQHVPEAGWETRGGATRHNGTSRRLHGWHRGSHPSVENKGEMNQPFIRRTETTNQNSKINHDDNKTLTRILFSAMTISQNSAD